MTLARRLEDLNHRFLLLQFTLSKQLDFLDGIFMLMADGIAARDALRLSMHAGTPMDRGAARTLLLRLTEGRQLSSGMRNLFKDDLAHAVAAAEQSANFAENGRKIVTHMREQLATRQGVIGKLVQPAVYIAVAGALYAMFAISIWPRFEVLAPVETWHFLARYNYRIGQFVVTFWPIILLGFGGMVFALQYLMKNWTRYGRQTADRIWPLSLYRYLSAAHMMEFLGTMMLAGHDFRTALATVAQHSSPFATMYISMMRRRLRDGRSIPSAIDVGFFASSDMAKLKLLAEFQGLNECLIRMGALARREVLEKLKRMAATFNTLGLAVVAAAYGGLVSSLYLNSANLQQQASF